MGEPGPVDGLAGNDLGPVVQAVVVEGPGDHGLLEESHPLQGTSRTLFDGGQEGRIQIGMRRLDAPRDAAQVAR